MSGTVENFGTMQNGTNVERVRLSGGGLRANILTYGGVVQDLRLDGHDEPLVLGFEDFEYYLTQSPYFGAIAGRCANRIRDGHLLIDGEVYQLDRNFIDRHHLHGGAAGIGIRLWTIDEVDTDWVRLSIRLDDGEMGYPGEMTVCVTFRLLPNATLDINIDATTDKTTLCNLAHHSYFNLDGSDTIHDHLLQIDANAYNPVDGELIPTGEVRKVDGTEFDFNKPKSIGAVSTKNLLDHNFCVSNERQGLKSIACLKSPSSGIAMEVRSTEPGLQVYDGAKIDISAGGLGGRQMGAFAGIALEPQVWPDAIHHQHFPQAVLHPGETYRQQTQYIFSKDK